ncbi:MAG: alpha/beta hydrolase [Clostridiales bacterium]|nr:alpha/beta hydrolase [Clostridiales bacterium]
MRYEVFDINIDYQKINVDNGGFQPKMSVYLPDNSPEIQIDRKHPTVVICPGGGYAMTSDREAEPIALRFAAAGCNAVVVRYSCVPARFPAALFELSYAVAKVRENAQEWNVDTDRIAVCGFSAGGHLAASFSTLWNRDFVKEYFDYQGGENKPNGMILGYPVITSGEHAHWGSIENLLGDKTADSALLELVSAEKQVNSDTPPAFIWHTFDDACVPVENSLVLAQALAKEKISTELHIYPKGPHGLALASRETGDFAVVPECQNWIDMAIRWLKNL